MTLAELDTTYHLAYYLLKPSERQDAVDTSVLSAPIGLGEVTLMSTAISPLDSAFVVEAQHVPGVEEIRRENVAKPRGVIYWVYANNLSSEGLDALCDLNIRLVDRFPDLYIDFRVTDRFDAPRAIVDDHVRVFSGQHAASTLPAPRTGCAC